MRDIPTMVVLLTRKCISRSWLCLTTFRVRYSLSDRSLALTTSRIILLPVESSKYYQFFTELH